MSTYFFPIELDDREWIEDRPWDYFTQINSELRPMAKIINLEKFQDVIARRGKSGCSRKRTLDRRGFESDLNHIRFLCRWTNSTLNNRSIPTPLKT
jgi:hypothetical protein